MKLRIMQKWEVCSSLLLYELPCYWSSTGYTKVLAEYLSKYMKSGTRGITHMGDAYYLESFAFINAQTHANDDGLNSALKELGFKQFGPTIAEKTGNALYWWVGKTDYICPKVKEIMKCTS